MILTSIAIITFGFIGITISLYITYHLRKYFNKCWSNRKQQKLEQENIMAIIHNNDDSILLKDISGKMITIKTQMDFIKSYEKLDKDSDISLILHTTGGDLSSAEAITNFILNHTGKGKFICYIPYYSYSGGCMIALACDEIVMRKNAIIGPCDAQKPMGSFSIYSVASIVDAVNYKKENREKISEEWLASSYDAKLCQERQKKYLEKLIKYNKFTEQIGNTIYDEFFSGKYNHDKTFSAQETKELGVNVTIVDEMPSKIKNVISDIS